MSERRIHYKNTGLDAKELRRRRENNSVQLRKQQRFELVSKKRTLIEDDKDIGIVADETVSESVTLDMVEGILQDDMQLVLENAQRIRKILSKEPQPPFDDVIQRGLVPRLVQLLDLHDQPTVQFEVAWILTNICSGTTEQTRVVVESDNALDKLIKLLGSGDLRVCEQAVWALGNIVGDGAEFRDKVLSRGFLPPLLALIRPDLEIGFLRNATWVLVNLCRNKEPPTDIEVIKQIIPALIFLLDSTDQMILIDSTWAVSYITELGPNYAQLIIDFGIVSKMTPLLGHPETKIQTAAIRALGCITTGSDDQTQAVIDAKAIPQLLKLLNENKDKVVKEALWFISNIAAGSHKQIQAVINGGILPIIIHYLSYGDYQQQKEASWTIFNYCLSGSPDQLSILHKAGVIPPLCDLLVLKDVSLIRNVLEALNSLLSIDESVREAVETCGGLDKIEALQNSENQDIYQFAFDLIDKYFS